MEFTWRVISEEVEGGEWGKVQGIRSINGRYKMVLTHANDVKFQRGNTDLVFRMDLEKNKKNTRGECINGVRVEKIHQIQEISGLE